MVEDLVYEPGHVKTSEYEAHKIKCAENFESLGVKIDRLELAMYGNKDLEIKGIIEMTKEMHAVFVGSGFTFKTVLKILAVISAIGAAFTFIWKLITFKISL